MDSKIIGQRINAALALRNVKQKELATGIGLSQDNTVSYWCSGKRKPNIEQIIQIAKFLNVSSDYLLGLSDVPTNDIQLKEICNYTGLSEKSINLLHIFSKKKRLEFEGFFVTPYLSNMPKYKAADFFSVSSFFDNFIIFARKHGIGTGLNILKNADDFLYALLQEKNLDDEYSKQHYQDERFASLFKIQKDFCFFIEDYLELCANLYFERFQQIKNDETVSDNILGELITDGEHTGKTE